MILRKIHKFLKNIIHPPKKQFLGKISFSQCGEDLIIDYVFKLRGILKPTYLDVGAFHPYRLNNTYLFYQKGCRGINIEANPNLIKLFYAIRPNDVNLNIGISNVEAELPFYILTDPTLSTFSQTELNHMIGQGNKLDRTIIIKTVPLPKVIHDYCNGIFPDLLSIDVEGLDFEILKTIEFEKSGPKIICVESAEYSNMGAGEKRIDLINYLIKKGYFEYATTNLNSIMVQNKFWLP